MSERMARLGILAGVLLCVGTAMARMGSYEKAVWLFLPMMIGIPIMFLGVVGLNPHRRRVALTAMAEEYDANDKPSIRQVHMLSACGGVCSLTVAVNRRSIRALTSHSPKASQETTVLEGNGDHHADRHHQPHDASVVQVEGP